MNIEQIIERANRGYGNDVVQMYFNEPDGDHGDTLARFVAIELEETFDKSLSNKEQLSEARRVIMAAIADLHNVLGELW